jgi:hypothetical protein
MTACAIQRAFVIRSLIGMCGRMPRRLVRDRDAHNDPIWAARHSTSVFPYPHVTAAISRGGVGWGVARCARAGRVGDGTMASVDVRRLAAIDMHGARGTMRRRRIIMAEFTAGAGGRVLGIWIVGCGLNYAVLAAFAVALSRPGVLEDELAGVDTIRELRRYSVGQLWIVLPLFLLVLAARSVGRRRA